MFTEGPYLYWQQVYEFGSLILKRFVLKNTAECFHIDIGSLKRRNDRLLTHLFLIHPFSTP